MTILGLETLQIPLGSSEYPNFLRKQREEAHERSSSGHSESQIRNAKVLVEHSPLNLAYCNPSFGNVNGIRPMHQNSTWDSRPEGAQVEPFEESGEQDITMSVGQEG